MKPDGDPRQHRARRDRRPGRARRRAARRPPRRRRARRHRPRAAAARPPAARRAQPARRPAHRLGHPRPRAPRMADLRRRQPARRRSPASRCPTRRQPPPTRPDRCASPSSTSAPTRRACSSPTSQTTARSTELERRTTVTRLGEGVDADGRARTTRRWQRVLAALDDYRTIIDDAASSATPACSPAPCATPPTARTSPHACARRATARRPHDRRRRGGAPDLPRRHERARRRRRRRRRPRRHRHRRRLDRARRRPRRRPSSFHVSTQAGVVRQTERHLATDPPTPPSSQALAADVARDLRRKRSRRRSARSVARGDRRRRHRDVAGGDRPRSSSPTTPPRSTATWRPARAVSRCILARLAALPRGRAPRASAACTPTARPTIVAGVVMLIEALRAFGLDEHRGLRARHPARRRPGAACIGHARRLRNTPAALDAATAVEAAASSRPRHLADSPHERVVPRIPTSRNTPGRMFDCEPLSPVGYCESSGQGCSCRTGAFIRCSGAIGSGEAASNRRLPPLGPENRPLHGTYPCPSCRGRLWKPPSERLPTFADRQSHRKRTRHLVLPEDGATRDPAAAHARFDLRG